MRAQLKHLLLDVGFKDKPKIIDLESRYGPLARLLIVDLYTMMGAATDARISRGSAQFQAKRLGIKDCDEILHFCIAEGIIQEEAGYLTNSRVIKDQESLFKEQERWRRKREKTEATPRPPGGNAEAEARKSENLNTEELKIEDLKEDRQPPPGKKQILDFIFLSEIEIENWLMKLGKEGYERACEKLNGWIGEVSDDPIEFQKRKQKGRNAGFTLQNWVGAAISNERGAAQKSKTKEETPEEFRARLKRDFEQQGIKI